MRIAGLKREEWDHVQIVLYLRFSFMILSCTMKISKSIIWEVKPIHKRVP
jgi:hypothetical protein